MGVFVVTLAVFLSSPVHQIFDSRYSLLVTESLLEGHGFVLDRFFHPAVREKVCAGAHDADYQFRCIDGHLYHYFPAGGPVLAMPFLLAGRALGLRPVDSSGGWSKDGERRLHRCIAAILMALFAVVIFELAATLLPIPAALALLVAVVFGTQVWSSASRGLWSQTWMILLVGMAVLELARAESDGREPRAVRLATLLAWAFFTRPTALLVIAAVALYLLRHRRGVWMTFSAVVAAWLSLFLGWSAAVFGTLVPPYYEQRLQAVNFAEAFAGNLVSPGRGLLLFLPHLLFLGYLLIRYPPRSKRALALLAGGLAIVHFVVASAFPHWWGGHSFGPRLLIDMLPWLALLAVIAVDGWLRSGAQRGELRTHGAEAAAAALLVVAAVVIHAGGALSDKSELWNYSPQCVDDVPSRVWDWSDPQFLAFATERPWADRVGD